MNIKAIKLITVSALAIMMMLIIFSIPAYALEEGVKQIEYSREFPTEWDNEYPLQKHELPSKIWEAYYHQGYGFVMSGWLYKVAGSEMPGVGAAWSAIYKGWLSGGDTR